MPKRSKKPAAQPRTPEEMFTPIGQPDPAPEPDGDKQEPDLGSRVDQLAKAVEGLVKAGSSREERLMGMFAQLANPQRQQQQQEPSKSAEPKPLPDPTKDPQGYAAAVRDNAAAAGADAARGVVQPANDQRAREQRVEGMWRQFQEKYPDLSDYDDIAQVVAGKIVGDAASRGISPETTMFLDPEGFMEKVAGKMNERIASIRGKDKDDEEDEDADGDGDPARTLGIPGQTQGGAGGSKPAGEGSTLISELREIQTKAKIY